MNTLLHLVLGLELEYSLDDKYSVTQLMPGVYQDIKCWYGGTSP